MDIIHTYPPMPGHIPSVHPHVSNPWPFDANQNPRQAAVARKYQPSSIRSTVWLCTEGAKKMQILGSAGPETTPWTIHPKTTSVMVEIRAMWSLEIKWSSLLPGACSWRVPLYESRNDVRNDELFHSPPRRDAIPDKAPRHRPSLKKVRIDCRILRLIVRICVAERARLLHVQLRAHQVLTDAKPITEGTITMPYSWKTDFALSVPLASA